MIEAKIRLAADQDGAHLLKAVTDEQDYERIGRLTNEALDACEQHERQAGFEPYEGVMEKILRR
jgi:hypothetical protein